MTQDENEIRKLLDIFQEGYVKRDTGYIEKFMEIYSKTDSSLIIGTNQQEVHRGLEGAKELFINDWNEWGDVDYNLETKDITVKGDMAWVFMDAEVKMKFPAEFINKGVVGMMKGVLEDEEISDRAKILDMLTYSALSLVEQSKGDIFECPIRVSLILTKEDEKWVIQHMHFSYPNTLFPSVRLGNWKKI